MTRIKLAKFWISFVVVPMVTVCLSGALRGDLTNTLYVTSGDGSNGPTLFALDGTSITYQVATQTLELPIAVRDSIWLGTYASVNTAREYDLFGNPTGNTSPFTPVLGADGTTDGINNYTVVSFSSSGTVFQGDGDWQNLNPIFTASGINDINGITFDTASDTLWISGDTEVQNYSLSGTLLGQFSHSNGRGSLAYDPLTDTLWHVRNGSDQLAQYSKTGTLLQNVTVSGLSGNNWGAEFRYGAIPEPSSFLITAAGLLGILARRRRR